MLWGRKGVAGRFVGTDIFDFGVAMPERGITIVTGVDESMTTVSLFQTACSVVFLANKATCVGKLED